MNALQALELARLAWERHQPQLMLELWPLEETPVVPSLGGTDGTHRVARDGTGVAAGVSSSGPAPLTRYGGAAPPTATAARPQTSPGVCAAGPQKGL